MPSNPDPDDADAEFARGNALQEQRRFDAAIACYRGALASRPAAAGIHNNLGVAWMALNRLDDAVASFQRATACQPGYAEAHNNLGVAFKRQGRFEEALECYGKALAIKPDYAMALFNIGTIAGEVKNYPEAVKWYRAALAVDPAQIEANQSIASTLEKLGELDAVKAHRDMAYGRQAVFIDMAESPVRTVLALWSAGMGNIPVQHLLPNTSVTCIVCIVEYVRPGELENLPAYDLIFNAIGDPDALPPARAAIDAFMRTHGGPLLNRPEAVARTARHLVPRLLEHIAGVAVPRTEQVGRDGVRTALLALPEERFPVLLRPACSHGGEHLVKIDGKPEAAAAEPWHSDIHYLTDYHDYRSADGHFRKYRIVYIDREPFPYHLAIGDAWLVHHDTAGMRDAEWKRREEAAFLADPASAIGQPAMAAIAEIGKTLDLDYGGVDFSILPDGRVLVFETNATMLVHPEDEDDVFAYKNPYVRRILDAFDAMLDRAAP